MTTLTRTDFVSSLDGKRIATDAADGDLKNRLRAADLDGSGDVAGADEAARLFREIDRVDNNGDAGSIRTHDGAAPTQAGILADRARQLATPNLRKGITRGELTADLRGKQVPTDALPDEQRAQLTPADVDGDGLIRGARERNEAWRQVDALDSNGDPSSISAAGPDGVETPAGRAARALRENAVDDPNAGALDESVVTWTPNAEALRRAEGSGLGRAAAERVPEHAETYREASELTGVPPQLIAAIHGNESSFGTYRPSTHGPESGYGLDDRWVTTRWGNARLSEHGLGTWQRGQDTPTARLQSAVIAAEHLKRVGRDAGIEVGPGMSQGEIAGAITAYTTGPAAGRRAESRGRSWMFDLNDDNPHPLHPGGTSRTSRGTVRVAPSRKEGLLRWDTLLPVIERALDDAPGVA